MANEFDEEIVQDFVPDTADRLDKVAIIARSADGFGQQCLAERAFRSLPEIEPLSFDVNTLLNATSVVRRRERERPVEPG